MDKHIQQLELAKAHFYAWRMPESYAIFRRFFDRLPFAFDPAHAQYMAVYVRLLSEMGKEREMGFYRGILQSLYHRNPNPFIAYSLVVLYLSSEPRLPELAKSLLDACISDSPSEDLTTKAKLFLASYYCSEKNDLAACQAIIDSISTPADAHVQRVLRMWQANLKRRTGNHSEAEFILTQIIASVPWEQDWYTVFSSKVILGHMYLDQSKYAEARALLGRLKSRTENQKLKCVARQLASLETKLESASNLGQCVIETRSDSVSFQYRTKRLRIKRNTSAGKLLMLFLNRKKLRKEEIIEAIYSRKYAGESDDPLVYYQVHSLRKQLGRKIGLPPDAIQTAGGSYLWRPEVTSRTNPENEIGDSSL
jgi:tetratricopeptide (TPR) repeat protein